MLVDITEIDTNLYFSPMSIENDTRPADIYSFVPTEYTELTDELNEYSRTLARRDDHRLIKNYIDINFNQYPFVSMWKRNGSIVGFATGWSRDIYPSGSIRILNRFYHDSDESRVKFTRELLRPSTFQCVQHQLLLAAKLGYDNAFISREPRTNKFFERFVSSLNLRSTHQWEFNAGPFLVAPDPGNPECWQSIALARLKHTDSNFWYYWRTK